jgi:hypothetical protein
LYRQGLKLHCPDENTVDPAKVRPFPVIIHIDASHADLFGNLKVAPIQVMPAMLDVEYWLVGSVVGAIDDVDEWAAPQ